MDDKILAKIKKLLALSKSANEHEAAAALSRAQKLMREHNVTASKDGAFVIAEKTSKGAPSNAEKLPAYVIGLADVIGLTMGCFCYYTITYGDKWPHHPKRQVVFYGPNERPEIAAYAFDVLSRRIKQARTEFIAGQRKNIKRATKTNRADKFCEGWVMGVYAELERFGKTPEEVELMRAYMSQKKESTNRFKKLNTREAKDCRGGDDALHAGYQDGKNVRLHQAVSGSDSAPKQIAQGVGDEK